MSHTHSNKHVLVIDDELEIREYLQDLLEEMGYVAVLASNILEAISCFKAHQYHVVIVDISMPFGAETIGPDDPTDGLDLALKFRKTGYEGKMLCISGLTDLLKDDKRMHVFDKIISKPFRADDFIKALI